MWIVDHDLMTVRTLTADERELLVGFVEGNLRGQEEARANALLRRVRSDSCWIGCDCIKPMPILNVALRDTGKLILRNNQTGPQHNEGCTFSHDAIKIREGGRPTSNIIGRLGDETTVALHGEFRPKVEPTGKPRDDGSESNGSSRNKKLVSLLLTMLERSDLAVYRPAAKKSPTDQFAAIRNSTTSYTMAPGIPLSSYLDTRISKQRLVSLSVKLKGSKEFGSSRRVGLLMDTIGGIAGRSISLGDDAQVDFFGHVERSTVPSFPALALATVTNQQPNTKFYEIANVATVPILSRSHMFPVWSDEDRTCVASIFALLDWLLKQRKIEVNAVRHLFSSNPSLLELRSKKLILSVDFSTSPLAEAPPASGVATMQLSDFEDLDALKKAIIKRYVIAHSV